MAENQQVTHRGDDKDPDQIYTKRLHEGKPHLDFSISSDIARPKQLLKKDAWKVRKDVAKQPSVQFASATVSLTNTIEMIDSIDRPADASVEGTYARTGAYAVAFKNEPMGRIPKAGAFVEAGVGRASAEFSVFEAEAKGPNASAGAEASAIGVGAMARAEIGSVSAKAGPLDVRLGLGVDTGVSVSPDGLEVRFLGTGFSIGPRTGISVLGSALECSIL